MRIERIVAKGFRNLSGEYSLPSAVTLVVGENNTGKSNLIDALRLLTYPHAGVQFSRWITMDDFQHDELGERTGDAFSLEAIIGGLTLEERARMVTCLAPSLGADYARLRFEAQIGARDRIQVEWFGGDSLQPGVEQFAKQALTHTYLPPLRDAASELRPGRANKLVDLIAALAPPESQSRTEIEEAAARANSALSEAEAVQRARAEVQSRLAEMAGPHFGQSTDLAMSEARFDKVVNTLRALAGDTTPLELHKNGLGYNNLLYMATLLAAIEHEVDEGVHLLLIEEPEAHLHPQLQDMLLRYFERKAGGHTQIVVTTHSPNFAAAAGVERITIMVRHGGAATTAARTPSQFGVPPDAIAHLDRFLDVTKAGLLFARSVVLVEGIAEQLLIPVFAKRCGTGLAESGITVVNVGGLSFGPFAELFAPNRVPIRCALISDGDPPTMEEPDQGAAPDDDGTEAQLISATARSLLRRQNPSLRVFLAEQTLEWDLVIAGNWDVLVDTLAVLHPRVSARISREHGPQTPRQRADAFLRAIAREKGPFAQLLARRVDEENIPIVVPAYIEAALRWASGGEAGE